MTVISLAEDLEGNLFDEQANGLRACAQQST
jgi:hypothetical protein